VDELPAPVSGGSYLQRGPRASVSAEAFGEWNKAVAFTPTVVEKSADQKKRLHGVLQHSFLFTSLEASDLNIIVDAMVERKVPADHRIIQEGEDGNHMYVIEGGFFECIKRVDEEDKVVADWKFAAMVIDRFCLITFTTFTVITTATVLLSAPHVLVE